jgi:hypothetical protein
MKLKLSWRIRLAQILLGTAIVLGLFVTRGIRAGHEPVHLSSDWSHRHLVFSPPKNLMQQFQLSRSVRYYQQWVRRNVERKELESDERGDGDRDADKDEDTDRDERGHRRHRPRRLARDWNAYLGIDSSNTAARIGAGNFPAKFSFDVTTANCTNDFVVYNTSLAGSATALAARVTGTFTAQPNLFDTVTITNGGTTLTLTAGLVNLGTLFATSPTLATDAANLAAAINRPGNGSSVGVSATSSGATVIVSATTAGTAGNGITDGASMTGFTWDFGHLVDGATGVPTIVAYNKLYSSCSGTVPSTYWAYNTGTGATVATSPVLSLDGTQIAFVQFNGTLSQLVLLKWSANSGSLSAPVAPTSATNAAYRTCTVPCLTTINFSTANGGANASNTKSSPFYDYAPGDDALYVGDDNGFLHKFTGVFAGTPGETVFTSGANIWPAAVNSTHVLTSPVFDQGVSGVFVGDDASTLYRVDATVGGGAGGITASASLGGVGFDEGPIVDTTAGNIYVFVRLNGSIGGAGVRASVCQFSASFAANANCTSGGSVAAIVSTTNIATIPLYGGDFDNIYFTSANGTGSLYVCGTTGGNPTLWRVPVNAGLLGAAVQGPVLTTGNATCSPITEFNNGPTDRMFLSVVAASKTAAPVSCPSNATGCLMSFDITTTTGWGPATATSATASVAGGASGVVVDNASGTTGASQIYFTPLSATPGNCTTANQQGIGGCAVQASQSGLN